MKKRTRWLTPSVLAIIAVSLLGTCYWWTRDAPPPHDSDLVVKRLDIPEKKNAFYWFSRAAKELYWPAAQDERIYQMLDGKAWDDELAKELLERNEQAFADFEKGLACKVMQVPEVKSFFDEMPYLSPWRNLARVCGVRARSLLRHGRDRDAAEELLKVIQFGRMVTRSKGPLLLFVCGEAIKSSCLAEFRALLGDLDLPPLQLIAYAARLDEPGSEVEGLKDTYRLEYVLLRNLLDDKSSAIEALDEMVPTRRVDKLQPVLTRVFFRPNATKRMMAALIREGIANAGRHMAECRYPLTDRLAKFCDRPIDWRLLRYRNAIGIVLVGMTTPVFRNIQEVKCMANVDLAATRLLLALRAYKLRNGHLPDELDELVPDYIDAVPLDDFDGKPMRYSREKKIIYSVGTDLVDSGGSRSPEQPENEEPTYAIEF